MYQMPADFFVSEAVVPMRRDPSESSEMISQLLFGDLCEKIAEGDGNWLQVRNTADGYEGWVNPQMLTPQPEAFREDIRKWRYVVRTGACWNLPDGSRIHLPLGARVPDTGSGASGFLLRGERWQAESPEKTVPQLDPVHIVELAKRFQNIPYLWGGCSGFGIDCSGFTQIVFRICGLALPRDSSAQFQEGTPLDFDSRKTGDLAFFHSLNKSVVSHVGIVVEDSRIIHSSGKVRIDSLTDKGIIHSASQNISHHLVGIKRFY
jgi:cell wall-associated NlpC family hydrolase